LLLPARLSRSAVLLWPPICLRHRRYEHRPCTFRLSSRSTIGPASISASTAAGVGATLSLLPICQEETFQAAPGVVGGTLGANFQTGGFVFGIEGDWDYSAINTGTSATICNFTGTCQTGNNWLATLRGRAGYAADRVLF